MGAGILIPFCILSFLALIILVVWMRNGSGNKSIRANIASILILSIIASWISLFSFGGMHRLGQWGMIVGILLSILSFFVPLIYNKVQKKNYT